MKPPHSIRYLQWECLILFAALPPLISACKPHGWIYVMLWVIALLAWAILKRSYGYSFRRDWNYAALRRSAKPIVLRFLPFAALLLFFTWAMIPSHLFSLPRERPQAWIMVMTLYPLLSVIPQEMLFRVFFLRRYAPWLTSPHMLAIASALAFGWVHILLQNWVAVVFSAAGGLLFGQTYLKTKSLAAVCFEHALYGCYIFTIGLGFYFYHGQAVH